MANGDISGVQLIRKFSSRSNPFWNNQALPFSGGYIDLKNFTCLNNDKSFNNTVLGFWEPKRKQNDFTFPYKNLYELINHSGTQSGSIGEYHFASSGDLINAGFPEQASKRYGYKYTNSGEKIGYNEVYIEGNATIDDLVGKRINCIMLHRFADSGLNFTDNGDFKAQKQKTGPGILRYQIFLTTGDLDIKDGIDHKICYPSIGSESNTENFLNLKHNNENFIIKKSGIYGEDLYGNFYISNSGNHRFDYKVNSLDENIKFTQFSKLKSKVRAGVMNRMPKRRDLFRKRNIGYEIHTSNLIPDEQYTGYIQFSGNYPQNAICNYTGIQIPVIYSVHDFGARASFDNFYFKYTGSHVKNINNFIVYPIGEVINIDKNQSGSYDKLTLGLTIYNTGVGVSGINSLNKISKNWFNPSIEAKLFWEATGEAQVNVLNNYGSVYFETGAYGSLPQEHYIKYNNQSGAFQNDIFFSINNTGQIPEGQFSGDVSINVSDSSCQNYTFPVLINYLP
jgi:hypothetical protein